MGSVRKVWVRITNTCRGPQRKQLHPGDKVLLHSRAGAALVAKGLGVIVEEANMEPNRVIRGGYVGMSINKGGLTRDKAQGPRQVNPGLPGQRETPKTYPSPVQPVPRPVQPSVPSTPAAQEPSKPPQTEEQWRRLGWAQARALFFDLFGTNLRSWAQLSEHLSKK